MSENLAGLWAQTIARQPEALAVIESASGRCWTRADLAAAVAGQRAALPAGSELAGRVIVLAGRNSSEWLAKFIALLEIGAIPVAIDADEPIDGQRTVARDLRATGVWRESGFEPENGPTGRRRSDVCLIKLTSGSTGTARPLAFTHAQMIADGRQVCATMGITPEDTNLAIIPFGHSYGLGNLVVPLLVQGTTVVIGAGPLPQVIAVDVARWRPTVFPAVPAILSVLTRADVAPADLVSLRLVISAGAPLDSAVAGAFAEKFGRRVHGFYGSSETGGICFDRTGEATLTGRSVGTPLHGVQLEFRRGDRFVVTSAAVMRRGRRMTADRGRLNEHGELELIGRVGRMVKVAGRRLDLAEVERALRGVRGVRDVWVTADSGRTDTIAAVVAGTVTAGEVRAALAPGIAAWKIPDRIVVVAEFPVTSRGKTDTRRLCGMLQG